MDDEYDLRKDNLGKEQKDKYTQLEKLIIPLMIKLAKSPEAYIHWPNRAQVIESQVKKIIAITIEVNNDNRCRLRNNSKT